MKTEEKTMNYYNGIASGYKNLYHEEQKLKISLILDYLPNTGNLLDLGCGDGVLNQFISNDVELFSLDLSSELLKLNSNSEPHKFCASILDIPFSDKKFDFISSFTVFQDLPDVKCGINETLRVLKDDGTFVLSFLHMARDCSLLLELIHSKFEIVFETKEIKDYIFVLKKKLD